MASFDDRSFDLEWPSSGSDDALERAPDVADVEAETESIWVDAEPEDHDDPDPVEASEPARLDPVPVGPERVFDARTPVLTMRVRLAAGSPRPRRRAPLF